MKAPLPPLQRIEVFSRMTLHFLSSCVPGLHPDTVFSRMTLPFVSSSAPGLHPEGYLLPSFELRCTLAACIHLRGGLHEFEDALTKHFGARK